MRITPVHIAVSLFLAALPIAAQNIQYPPQFTDNPNQIVVTPGWLFLNKMHFAGTWSSSLTYAAQDLVIYGTQSFVSLQTNNLNNPPSSSPGWWTPLPGAGGGGGGAAWGNILGSISNQLDLGVALNGKEPAITPGTTSQFWRGDKTWQSAPVASFNGRTGAIVPVAGDYSSGQVTEDGNNAYFTTARAITAVLPALSATSPVVYNPSTGVFSCPTCGGATTWGGISGNIVNQSDLNTALGAKEPAIATGTTSQFWAGDKTWVSPTTDQVSEGATNQYFTSTRARAALSGTAPISYNSSTGVFSCSTCSTGAYTGAGTGALATTVSTVLQSTGRSLDFCATVDGTTDNTTCLQTALNNLGVKYQALEIEPDPTGSTTKNYVCTSLSWGSASYGHIHLMRGAQTSCALPPVDATHDIVDDNQSSPVPDQFLNIPASHQGAVYTCTAACGKNDLTISGTYTSSNVSNILCVEIFATAPETFKWGISANGSACTTQGPVTITANTPVAIGSTGLSVTFASNTGHAVVSGSNGDSWEDQLFAQTTAPGAFQVSTAGSGGLHSASFSPTGLAFGAVAVPGDIGIQAESAANGNLNVAGGNLNIAPGAGTGNGNSGRITIATCAPGSSGYIQNACTAQFTFTDVHLSPAGDMGTQTIGNPTNRPIINSWQENVYNGIRTVPNTVAGLPTSPAAGLEASVSDGASSTDCTVGSGSNSVKCRYNGTNWQAVRTVISGHGTGPIVAAGCTGTASGGAGTVFLFPTGSTTACSTSSSNVGFPMPYAATITAIYARATVGAVSGTDAISVYVNGAVAGTLTCNLASSGSAVSCNDTAAGHAINVSAGDAIAIGVVVQGSDTLQNVRASITFQ